MSLLALIVATLAASSPAAASACDHFASPKGFDRAAGSQSRPFRTAQKLVNATGAGETGCLLAGTYSAEVDGPFVMNIRHGGRRGAPLTIRSAPGQRAQLHGIIYLWKQSSHVTISDLDIDAERRQPGRVTGIQIAARHTILERNTITNRGTGICSVLGSTSGYGKAVGTIIRMNTFHDCGGTRTQFDHSLYLENTSRVRITDNLFLRTGTYAVHLYPHARRTLVARNVMVDNGGGVIFAGDERFASGRNVVEHNVITGTYRKPGIHSFWGGPVGKGNVARWNCLSNQALNVDRDDGGFKAYGNEVAQPLFRDASAGDYRLAPGSPCLGVLGQVAAGRLLHSDYLSNAIPRHSG